MNMKKIASVAGGALLAVAFPVFLHASGGTVVEEIVARVNNDIITLSEYQKAEGSLHQEAQQDCQGCSEEKINDMVADEKKNLLSVMIDRSLMVQRAKDMNIDVDTDVIKQLDEIRQQNNLPSMDALQKAVESQGVNWEDYKQQFKDRLLTQKVVQQEVGPTVKISGDEVKKYYQTHQSQFVKPEEVDLSEIFLSTENKSPQEAAAVKAKAEALEKRIKAGEDFGALAKRFSEDSAASVEGEVGEFQRGTMAPDVEKAVFSLKRGDSTDVMLVHNGFEIYHVNQRFEAGLQPLTKVEDEIENGLYQSRIQAAMQKYYTQLRHDSYIITAPGYIDTGAVAGNSVITEVPFNSEKAKEAKKKKTPKATAADDEDGNP
ncbi:MAG TPA: peptidylprolyl isomerase [Candidatus Acidoferrales bacterium]|nr:peptidylprolyl isomerase [Candidatus Acidoferrales bacterium]